MIRCKMSEKVDELIQGNCKIIQDKDKFCFGIDSLLISKFATARLNDEVFDLGTGTGVIPLVMSHTTKAKHFTALEVQVQSVDMARRSVELNGLENKISVVECDIKNVGKKFNKNAADVVVSNPPYMTLNQGEASPKDSKSIARTEILCRLEDVVSAADFLLKPNGKFFMIHRPNRLGEIFAVCLKFKLVVKRLQLIYPFADKSPTMVMIEARKNVKQDLKILEPLIMYSNPGVYSEQLKSYIDN